MILTTVSAQWLKIRNQIAAVDSGGTYDAVSNVTDRLVARMTNASDAAIAPVDISTINAMELRCHFDTNARTATYDIFMAREAERTVKYVASVAVVAGTQTNEEGRFFGKTSTVTSYWIPDRIGASDNESNTGISQVVFDKLGYTRIWILVSALSGGNITIEGSGY